MIYNVIAKINAEKIARNIQSGIKLRQKKLDAVVLADSNYYCPFESTTLQKSAIYSSRIGAGELVWDTDYARRQYYNYKKPPYQPNPNARGKWFEAAKARWLKKWIKVVDGTI